MSHQLTAMYPDSLSWMLPSRVTPGGITPSAEDRPRVGGVCKFCRRMLSGSLGGSKGGPMAFGV